MDPVKEEMPPVNLDHVFHFVGPENSGRRHLGSAAETANLRHHQRVGGNWADREEIQEQHPMEVSTVFFFFFLFPKK